MSNRQRQFPAQNAHHRDHEQPTADPLSERDRAIVEALRQSGFEVKSMTMLYGFGWAGRYVMKSSAA